ncbi:hypothetical protein [Actinoplanes sp. NBRC 101535]|uniref:hypothetical protein n=1 Tax=Actinoplanes sp. NBRC 101535 TaxID=3032196 RepID=UPI0025532C89|nr:hypothetical protein [Actinoplanes sp. NBRC 101535]
MLTTDRAHSPPPAAAATEPQTFTSPAPAPLILTGYLSYTVKAVVTTVITDV